MNPVKNFLDSYKGRKRSSDAEMSFFDHLEELRWHIIRSLVVVLFFAVVAFSFKQFLFDSVIFGPKNVHFWTYRQLCKLAGVVHQPDLCVKQIHFQMMNTELAGQFTWHFTIAIMGGFVIGFPYLLFELWLFISPALKPKEKKDSQGIIGYGSILFLAGVFFGYYIIMPLTITFLGSYTVSSEVINQITLDSYFSMLITLSLASGVTFEIPIIIYFLSLAGIVTPKLMRSTRRYAVLGILVLAAVITPSPDVVSQIIVATPLFILYELSIFVSAGVERRKAKLERGLIHLGNDR